MHVALRSPIGLVSERDASPDERTEKPMGTMTTQMHSGKDVVAFLKGQHEQVKQLFEDVEAASGEEKERAFFQLRRLLAVHETAEEEIVHPAARRARSNGDAVIDARLREEKAAKTALAELEELDLDSPEFDARFMLFKHN